MSKQPLMIERVQNLEKEFMKMSEVISAFPETVKTIQGLFDVVAGILKVNGPDFDKKVEAEVMNIKMARAQQEADRLDAQFKVIVDKGLVVPETTVNAKERLVVGGREVTPTGLVLPGIRRKDISELVPEAVEFFQGKGVGEVYTSPTGFKFELVEIWSYAVPKAEDKQS